MYDQIREDTLYAMLYAAVAMLSLIACCYLLFRRGNAFAKDITPPARLRRWTAMFFAILVVNHVWYMPIFFLTSSEDIMMIDLIGGLLDSMTVFPLMIVVLLAMLQDRRRPLWPVTVMFAPIVVGNAFNFTTRSYDFLPIVYIYSLLVFTCLIIYMVCALRRYGRWLRDNFADLEHKEVWQSFVVLAIMLLVFFVYALINENQIYTYVMLAVSAVLICFLLWRVETISDLSILQLQNLYVVELAAAEAEDMKDNGPSQTNHDNIGSLLQQHCIDTRLYLQHDLNISQLAKTIGINRLYLTKYFSSQGTNYNAYINDLRIRHFVSLYHEAVASHRSFSAQQLAQESGFYTYRTFSDAFKRKIGYTVSAWIKAQNEA